MMNKNKQPYGNIHQSKLGRQWRGIGTSSFTELEGQL